MTMFLKYSEELYLFSERGFPPVHATLTSLNRRQVSVGV